MQKEYRSNEPYITPYGTVNEPNDPDRGGAWDVDVWGGRCAFVHVFVFCSMVASGVGYFIYSLATTVLYFLRDNLEQIKTGIAYLLIGVVLIVLFCLFVDAMFNRNHPRCDRGNKSPKPKGQNQGRTIIINIDSNSKIRIDE